MNADRKRLSLERRDELEYLAAFMNPEAVSKIIKGRQFKESAADPELEKIFADQIKKQFGRDLKSSSSKTDDSSATSSISLVGKR